MVPAALFRLAGAVLVEQRDEWEASTRRYLSEGSMRQLGAVNAALFATGADRCPGGRDSRPRAHCGTIKTADPHGVNELHHYAGRGRSRPFFVPGSVRPAAPAVLRMRT